ncbi:hypothetical protein KHHGKMAE_4906 [Methylobacterium persicinum]|nr:hypothetical protein KHHGKMAE_4906 [Methylobacterium persicinum]
MRRPERVVDALRALGEARQAPALAQGPDPVPATRQDLVRVALMPDIPHDPVVGRVEHVVQRHRQLDHPEARAQMPPGDRHRVDHLRTHRIRHGLKLRLRHAPQIRRLVHTIQQR